jgi:hypothetical protein
LFVSNFIRKFAASFVKRVYEETTSDTDNAHAVPKLQPVGTVNHDGG